MVMATSTTTTDLRQTVSPTVVTTTTNQATQAMIIDNNNDDYEYDLYDQTVDAALTRLRDADAMSEEETEDEREEVATRQWGENSTVPAYES